MTTDIITMAEAKRRYLQAYPTHRDTREVLKAQQETTNEEGQTEMADTAKVIRWESGKARTRRTKRERLHRDAPPFKVWVRREYPPGQFALSPKLSRIVGQQPVPAHVARVAKDREARTTRLEHNRFMRTAKPKKEAAPKKEKADETAKKGRKA